MRKIRRANSCPAFTLLEMLVGIAIVCVLGALLFPLVSNMRASGLAARCTSNLRQVGALFQAQAAENNEVIKLFYYKDANPHAMIRWSDYLVNENYLDANNKVSSCPVNFSREEGRVYGIQNANYVNDPYSVAIDGADGSRAVRLNTIEQPSKYWLLTDSWSIGDQKQIWFVRDTNPNAQMHMRHHGKANILFADGHVAAFNVQETKDFTINPITTAADEAGKRVIYP